MKKKGWLLALGLVAAAGMAGLAGCGPSVVSGLVHHQGKGQGQKPIPIVEQLPAADRSIFANENAVAPMPKNLPPADEEFVRKYYLIGVERFAAGLEQAQAISKYANPPMITSLRFAGSSNLTGHGNMNGVYELFDITGISGSGKRSSQYYFGVRVIGSPAAAYFKVN